MGEILFQYLSLTCCLKELLLRIQIYMYCFFLPPLLPDRADKFFLSCIFGLAASMVWGYLGKQKICLWKYGEFSGSLADTCVFSPVIPQWLFKHVSGAEEAALKLAGDCQCDRAVISLPTVCGCECDQHVPRPPQLLSPCCALPCSSRLGAQL